MHALAHASGYLTGTEITSAPPRGVSAVPLWQNELLVARVSRRAGKKQWHDNTDQNIALKSDRF
jgi:hypothetical protein